MCGIIGYVGKQSAIPFILSGLRQLEARGYDSAGAAVITGDGLVDIRRAPGKLGRLEQIIHHLPLEGSVGVGHVRWATQGKPTEENAHPHIAGGVVVVHNGVIENFRELRAELQRDGQRQFMSETDTEVVPHLIDAYLNTGLSPLEATMAAIGRLEGSFALGILFQGRKDLLIGVKHGSPLVVGIGTSGILIGSSELALYGSAHHVIHLEDDDIVMIDDKTMQIYDLVGRKVNHERKSKPLVIVDVSTGKAGHKHFMLKEILEQPESIGETHRSLVDPTTHAIAIPSLPFDFRKVDRLRIVGCGTAYFAALVAKSWFNSFGIAVEAEVASEFIYAGHVFGEREGGIVISQSGETADTREALKRMKEGGCPALAIVNVPGSAIDRNADGVIYTKAYPEIAVASTKAFTAQLTALGCIVIQAARDRETITLQRESEITHAFDQLPIQITKVLGLDHQIREIAEDLRHAEHVFYVGRGVSYPIALEGALKMKEISYIHAEGCPAGEWKHGPLAMIDDTVPVIGIAPPDPLFIKTAGNLEEIRSRSGKLIVLSDEKGCEMLRQGEVWHSLALPKVDDFVAPILYTVALQLLAYHTALLRGHDIDQPRNLAKSVTVE